MLPKLIAIVSALFYLIAAFSLWRWLHDQTGEIRQSWFHKILVAVLLHLTVLSTVWISSGGIDISFFIAGLLISCLVTFVSIIGAKRWSLHISGIVVWPTAALVLLAYAGFSGEGSRIANYNWKLNLHAALAVSAFAMLAVASAQASLIALQDRALRRRHFEALMHNLPSLARMETLLFQLIGIGFILLTMTLITGGMFVEDLMSQHLAHKTILSCAAWIVFGVLIWGRKQYGWRGKFAIRMTLSGIIVLLLAYFGSKLVLEIILNKNL